MSALVPAYLLFGSSLALVVGMSLAGLDAKRTLRLAIQERQDAARFLSEAERILSEAKRMHQDDIQQSVIRRALLRKLANTPSSLEVEMTSILVSVKTWEDHTPAFPAQLRQRIDAALNVVDQRRKSLTEAAA